MGHQFSRHEDCPIFKHFEIWYRILICLFLGSRILHRKVFVLQTKLWIPPFQWIMSQLSSMFVAREIKQNPCGHVLWDTLYLVSDIINGMLSPYLTECLHHVIKFALKTYEDSVHNFWTHVYIMFRGMFSFFIKKYFHNGSCTITHFWRHVYTVLEEMAFYKPYTLKIDELNYFAIRIIFLSGHHFYMNLCPSVRSPVCPSVCLSVRPSVRLSVCPSQKLCVSPSPPLCVSPFSPLPCFSLISSFLKCVF